MKICGVVTEYNPFHNGHIHHIQEARRLTGCDYLIVVMSGDFVQRGTPAIIDKYERTRMAIQGGADLVVELPSLFACASAEIYATAGVSLLYQLGCVDSICFGSEAGRIEPLKKIAEVLNREPQSYREALRDYLRTGVNFPTARAMALEMELGDSIEDLDEILASPNNILGIEYLRAIDRLNAPITPYTTQRWKTDYNALQPYDNVASATALRNMLYEEDGATRIVPYVSPYTAREFALKMGVCTPVRSNDFSQMLQYRIFSEKDHLTDYLDFSQELSDRVNNLLPSCYTFKEWAEALKTKVYTRTRINRALLHLILDFKESDLKEYADEDYCMYMRILGFRQSSGPMFSRIKENTNLPLISKMADARKILPPKAMALLEKDIHAADLFRSVVYQKFGTQLKDEYTAGVIKM